MAGGTDTNRYVFGLGNPGLRYRKTRHNVGFMVLKQLCRRWAFGRAKSKFHSRVWTGRIGPMPVLLLAPQTYMNRSGQAVAEALAFYRAKPSAALVVLDDLSLPTGRLRARASGSEGGHKGLGDILAALGGEDVPRLRIGIGTPPEGIDAVEYVLTRIDKHQKQVMAEAIARAADAAQDWVAKGIDYVMDHYNASSENA